MQTLDGRVAVVTGAGSGIGQATSVLLAERGAHVALVDVSPGSAEETAAEVRARGVRASVHKADVGDLHRMQEVAAEVVDAHGAVHVLVNNAGVTSAGRFVDETVDDLHWIVDINVWGVVHGCHVFLPHLREVDEAHIVNVSSMVGLLGLPQNAIYSLTKGAVRSFTEALRSELVNTHIGVSTVFPGAIRTNIMFGARGAEAARLASMRSGRFERLAPYVLRPPEAVARKIVAAIDKDKPRTLVGPDARILDLSARLLPGRSGLVGKLVDRLTR